MGEEQSFCETGINSAQTSTNCKDVLTLIQEDINIADALLVVAVRNHRHKLPEPRLVRLHKNGSQDIVAGDEGVGGRFSNISSILQLNRSTILIAEPDKQCIRFVDINTRLWEH